MAEPKAAPMTLAEEAQVRAVKATRLSESADFRWWRGLLEEGANKMRTKLVMAEMKDSDFHLLRGKIRGIGKALSELDRMAASLAAFQGEKDE